MKHMFDYDIVKRQKTEERKRKPGKYRTFFFFLAVITIAAVWSFWQITTARPGGKLIAEQDGEFLFSYMLNSGDKEFDVLTADGGMNHVRVQGGRVAVTDADCPDKVCVKSGWILNSGESIICLPHKLVLRIEGEPTEGEPDAVAG